jgi:phenylacetate-coenzyme A ligase PaaK-like adenylate-forming protein
LPWQQQRLFRLLCHARDTTDVYQHIIPDNLTPSLALAVLSSLPVITRQHISRELPRFVSRRFAARKLVLQHTSGSTGIPLSFYRDRASLIRQKAEVAYFGSWVGYQPGMRYLYVGPNRPRIRGWLRNELSLWSTYPDDSWFVKLADTLQTRRVRILVAHPSILITFAAYLSQHSASVSSA